MADSENGPSINLGQGDVQEYVGAFQASSDRARYALFTVIVATVLVAIANYNVQSWGWPSRRLSTWYRYARGVAPETSTRDKFPFFGGDAEELRTAREEYIKQFAARAVFTASPIPGVSIDVNDVGLIGGVALCLLMIVQALCVMREHENLFLALYKVRCLHDMERATQKRGDSRANLLYHALAMSQVLSSPPTLARWEDRSMLSHLYLIFYVPAAAYMWVVADNVLTADIAASYGAPVIPLLILQTTMLVMLLILATICLLNSKAMADRWQRVFFRINPQLRRLKQPSEWQWLRIGRWSQTSEDPDRDLQSRVVVNIVDSLDVAAGRFTATVEIRLPTRPIRKQLLKSDLAGAVEDLKNAGRREAMNWCEANRATFVRLESFEAKMNAITDTSWEIGGTWCFSYNQ